jgi:hypothetical protein
MTYRRVHFLLVGVLSWDTAAPIKSVGTRLSVAEIGQHAWMHGGFPEPGPGGGGHPVGIPGADGLNRQDLFDVRPRPTIAGDDGLLALIEHMSLEDRTVLRSDEYRLTERALGAMDEAAAIEYAYQGGEAGPDDMPDGYEHEYPDAGQAAANLALSANGKRWITHWQACKGRKAKLEVRA